MNNNTTKYLRLKFNNDIQRTNAGDINMVRETYR